MHLENERNVNAQTAFGDLMPKGKDFPGVVMKVYGIKLPADYVEFLTTTGNGG